MPTWILVSDSGRRLGVMYVLTRVRRLYERRRQGYFVSTLGILSRNKFAVGVLAVLLLIVVCAVFPSYVSPYDPYEMHAYDRFLPPTSKYLLGTDLFGRDTLSRIIWGSRVSLYVAGISVIIALLVGAMVGLAAGFRGGMLDELIMRIVDGLLVFPDVFLGLIIIALLGTGMEKVMLAMGVMFAPAFARVARGVTLSEREKEYVLASRSLGDTDRRTVVHEILPNCIAPLMIQATLYLGYGVLYESFFSFLGLGVKPPTPTWGSMISSGVQVIRTDPWLSIFPGLAIFLTVLALNIFGDGLRDALDPRLRIE